MPKSEPDKKKTSDEDKKHVYENVVDYKSVKEDTAKKLKAQTEEQNKKTGKTAEHDKAEARKNVYENVGYKTFKKEMVNESPAADNPYSAYNSISSMSTDTTDYESGSYSVYDTMSSTSVSR